jgi:hypothetical protein
MRLRRNIVFLVGVLAGGLASASPAAADTPRATVVELFTSQGCSACPKANDYLARIATRPDIIALSYSVDHWDYLGWRDTFAKPEFTRRQKVYARTLAHGKVYTPQIVIDGAVQGSGARTEIVAAAITERRATAARGLSITPARTSAGPAMRVDAAPHSGPPAEIWLVAFIPGDRMVPVGGGENAGRSIRHANVVLRTNRAGAWDGAAVTVSTAGCTPACAVLVQEAGQGPILGAAVTKGSRQAAGPQVAGQPTSAGLVGP